MDRQIQVKELIYKWTQQRKDIGRLKRRRGCIDTSDIEVNYAQRNRSSNWHGLGYPDDTKRGAVNGRDRIYVKILSVAKQSMEQTITYREKRVNINIFHDAKSKDYLYYRPCGRKKSSTCPEPLTFAEQEISVIGYLAQNPSKFAFGRGVAGKIGRPVFAETPERHQQYFTCVIASFV